MTQDLVLQVTAPYERDRYGVIRRPTCYYDTTRLEDHPEPAEGFPLGYSRLQWTLGTAETICSPSSVAGLSNLSEYPQAITKANMHLIWPRIKKAFPVDKVPSHYYEPLVRRMLELNGWSNLYDLFEIQENQTGWGYMGGTGCGRLIHFLHFDKVLGVQPDVAAAVRESPKLWVKWHLATLLFSSMLGEVKKTREDNKHLRDGLAEDELFVSLRARPECQETVRYVGAHGYPVRGAKADFCSCTKCAKKLGVPVNNTRRRLAGAKEV